MQTSEYVRAGRTRKGSQNQMIKRAFLVRMKGLEPIRLTAPDPKSGLATNYNTSASEFQRTAKLHIYFKSASPHPP